MSLRFGWECQKCGLILLMKSDLTFLWFRRSIFLSFNYTSTLEEICKYIEPQKVRWYFNTYDWENNKDNIDKIRKLGFRVKHCRRW